MSYHKLNELSPKDNVHVYVIFKDGRKDRLFHRFFGDKESWFDSKGDPVSSDSIDQWSYVSHATNLKNEMLDLWDSLAEEQQESVLAFLKAFIQK